MTRYAEEQQDLALLSISTFQRALKDPNQLIRASALRVLSSIRVPVIVPIVMLAIRDSAVDMSPFVRKTAAHAIPKLYSIDPDQKEELVAMIEKLLGDRTTLVVGSAVMAFEEVCPERTELIHKQFRKLCNLLADIDEWGQVVIVNMLLRYARTQFVDPNKDGDNWEKEVSFYGSEDDSDENEVQKPAPKSMDPDHRLLLKNAKPLLQSRNAAVVMATAQLYYHLAPRPEVQVVAKAMIRLLRSSTEVQSLVLNCIASMTSGKRNSSMFEPHLRNFFIGSGTDPTHIKILKLEIMTNLATAGNIGIILREFQSYITGQDKVCVAATIQAIGRCAATIEEVTDTCLNGLVHLLSNRDEAVVAESVVVIKRLLQTQAGDHTEIIEHMAKLVDTITEPAAKAAILWVLGEYSERVPKIAPDVLRKMAKTFPNEDPQVKLQILNLAIKLCLCNPKQTRLLAQYVFNLAKYDMNYDIRDRARFMRGFIFSENKLSKCAKKIFLAAKPAPYTESKFYNRQNYQLGSMSHYLNTKVNGYQDLPDFPEEAPDASVRNVEPVKAPNPWEKTVEANKAKKKAKAKSASKGFYSEESSSASDSGSSGSSSGSSSESSSESEDSEDEGLVVKKDSNTLLLMGEGSNGGGGTGAADTEDSSSDSDESSSEESESSSDSNDEKCSKKQPIKKAPVQPKSSNLDLLLSLEDDLSSVPVHPSSTTTPTLGGLLTPSAAPTSSLSPTTEAAPMFVPVKENMLLSKMNSNGLQITYRFSRSKHLYSDSMTSIQLTLKNLGAEDLTEIKIGSQSLAPGMALHEFPTMASLPTGATQNATIGIDFNDSTNPASLYFVASGRTHQVQIQPKVGELIRPINMSEAYFEQERGKLRGMNEVETTIELPAAHSDDASVKKRIYEHSNLLQVPSLESNVLKFAGHTNSKKHVILLSLENGKKLTVNCEKMVMGSMLSKEIKAALQH